MRNPYLVSRSLASHSTINSGTYFYPVFSLGCKPVTQTLPRSTVQRRTESPDLYSGYAEWIRWLPHYTWGICCVLAWHLSRGDSHSSQVG